MRQRIKEGLPVLATCAGLILLAKELSNDPMVHFATLPITVRRNAYGRQLGSFRMESDFGEEKNVPMTFIRAPYIEKVSPGVKILKEVDHHIVAVRYQNQIALSFHPELDSDDRIHRWFLEICQQARKDKSKDNV